MRSVGEVAAHISIGRIEWFHRMGAPGSSELAAKAREFQTSSESAERVLAGSAGELTRWLELSWNMVARTLETWTVGDLALTYRHPYQGKIYAVSRQWTIWRIMSHDIHHGGQLTIMLGAQGIVPLELAELGGHLTLPPLADEPNSEPQSLADRR
jgi:uncharacterized damage-inducible protein DinB